jgi:hypothetical protein
MNKLFTILLFLVFQNGISQCYPVFKPKASQPPAKPNGLYSRNEGGRSPHAFYYILNTVYQGAVRYDIWDGSSWTSLNITTFSGGGLALMKWNNRLIGYGRVTAVDTLKAPKGKYFGFMEYKNGRWDSIPGCTFDSSFFFFDAVATNQDLYFQSTNVSNAYKGHVFRYDTTTSKFTKIIDFDRAIYGCDLIAGTNRLLVAKVANVNGTPVKGFCYVENDSIKLNTNATFDPYMIYGMDLGNDHIYAFKYADDPTIYEYWHNIVQTRTTRLDIAGANGDCQVLNGKIIWQSFEGSDINHYNIMCPGENEWKRISKTRNPTYWGNPHVSKDGIFVMASEGIYELGTGARITGTAFIDSDSSCTLDSGEQWLKKYQVTAKSRNSQAIAFTDDSGHYEMFVIPDTFKMTSNGPGPSSCGSGNVLATGSGVSYSRDLPVLPPTFYDLRVKLLEGTRVRWNSMTVYDALVENWGIPYDSAHFEFRLDSRIVLTGGDDNIKSISGNTAKGSLYNLGYYDKRIVKVFAWIDSANTKPDSIVCSKFFAYLHRGEKDSTNNRDSICQKVVYSLDPNHKDCDKSNIPVAKSSRLQYYIGFQNEGNDDAHDVVLVDTLSGLLSLENLVITGVSHPYTMAVNGRVLTVTFKDIYLKPKKENEALSQGFFKFSINTMSGLKNGDSITNRAYIYFDLNKPVITDLAVVMVGDPNSSIIQLARQDKLLVYPNPSSNTISIRVPADGQINIYSVTGELVYSGTALKGQLEVNISSWPVGLYLIRCGNLSTKLLRTE